MTGKKQISQYCQHMDLATVLDHAAQPGFLKAELLLDHLERRLTLGEDVSFGCLNQILQLPVSCNG